MRRYISSNVNEIIDRMSRRSRGGSKYSAFYSQFVLQNQREKKLKAIEIICIRYDLEIIIIV